MTPKLSNFLFLHKHYILSHKERFRERHCDLVTNDIVVTDKHVGLFSRKKNMAKRCQRYLTGTGLSVQTSTSNKEAQPKLCYPRITHTMGRVRRHHWSHLVPSPCSGRSPRARYSGLCPDGFEFLQRRFHSLNYVTCRKKRIGGFSYCKELVET